MVSSYEIKRKSLRVVWLVCVLVAAGLIVSYGQVVIEKAGRVISGITVQPSTGSQSPSIAGTSSRLKPIRIGTFNIRMFPCNTDCACLRRHGYDRCKRRGTGRTSFKRLKRELHKLHVDILAVNEILEPESFSAFVKAELGTEWNFVYSPQGGPLKVGFLYNSSRTELMSSRIFTKIYTEVDPVPSGTSKCRLKPGTRMRPAFACRFQVADSGLDFYAVILHLKSGPCSGIRRQQWRILELFIDELEGSDREIIVLGDFNDFRKSDRDWEDFQARKDFTLISDSIPCSFLGKAKKVTLDHMLASRELMNTFDPTEAEVSGPCARGCGRSKYRKAFSKRVSDHCPIVTELQIPQ
jgi:endonuclease/exonuclease/phosphatase family metal-dependent hydrolase